jgi:hypothetical protein
MEPPVRYKLVSEAGLVMDNETRKKYAIKS